MKFHPLLSAILLAAIAVAVPPIPAQAPEATAEVESLLLAAGEKVDLRDYAAAVKLYKRAIKASADRCAPCQIGLGKAYAGLGAHKDAAESAEAALRLTDDPALQGVAWNQLALAQVAGAGKDSSKLRLAEASFRKVLALLPDLMTHFNLGITLLRLGQDDEGLAELRIFVERAPSAAQAKTARDILENPRRARETMLPSLELVTLDGEFITNEELAGKVVLIDFWGTWCAPCRAAIPSLKALVERSQKLPLVVLSVSNDSDEAALKEFISEHGMTWPQIWDKQHSFGREMNVSGFPTYLLADHEGAIVFRYSGWSDAVERAIQNEIRRAVAKARHAAAATTPGS